MSEQATPMTDEDVKALRESHVALETALQAAASALAITARWVVREYGKETGTAQGIHNDATQAVTALTRARALRERIENG